MQCLLARVASSSGAEGTQQPWVTQVCKGTRLQDSKWHNAKAPYICKGKACLAVAMES